MAATRTLTTTAAPATATAACDPADHTPASGYRFQDVPSPSSHERSDSPAKKKSLPDADVRFVDSGHFALETHVAEIATAIGEFLTK
jgi:hypothetical protein